MRREVKIVGFKNLLYKTIKNAPLNLDYLFSYDGGRQYESAIFRRRKSEPSLSPLLFI